MAFDHHETPQKKKSSTDDMVALGHMAVNGLNKPITRKITKKSPIPKESRLAFSVGIGVFIGLVLVALVRAHFG